MAVVGAPMAWLAKRRVMAETTTDLKSILIDRRMEMDGWQMDRVAEKLMSCEALEIGGRCRGCRLEGGFHPVFILWFVGIISAAPFTRLLRDSPCDLGIRAIQRTLGLVSRV